MRTLNIILGAVIFGLLLLQIATAKQGPAMSSRLSHAEASAPLDPEQSSPDSRFLVQVQGKSLTMIRVFDGMRRTTALPGRVLRLWWSPDSLRLTVIVSSGTSDGSETMLILPID